MDKKNILIPAILAIAAATIYLMILTAKERTLMSAYETKSNCLKGKLGEHYKSRSPLNLHFEDRLLADPQESGR